MSETGQHVQAVCAVLERINEVWLEADPNEIAKGLEEYFDDQAVIVGPSFAPMAHGKHQSIASFVDFRRHATIHSCTFGEPAIHMVGDTAVATSAWQLAYTMDDRLFEESGHDIYVFTNRSGAWCVVWRAMFPD